MIEFSGYLSGSAEAFFYKKSRYLGLGFLLVGMILVLPTIIVLSVRLNDAAPTIVYCAIFPVLCLLSLIPKRKKEKRRLTPKRIYTEDDCITCVANGYVETKFVDDVKMVVDHGEFYEIIFPFGKVSDKFICQKDLLTQGSLQSFEELFKGKVIKKN